MAQKNKSGFWDTVAKGLVVLLPLWALVLLLYWTVVSVEEGVRFLLRWVVPAGYLFPGLGFVALLGAAYLVGLSLKAPAGRRGIGWIQHGLEKIPWIKSLYGATQDVVNFFAEQKSREFNRVVLVKIESLGFQVIGFVTQEKASLWPSAGDGEERVGVYLPMSYQVGGYWVLVPKKDLTPLPLSIEDAARIVFTAGMSAGEDKEGSGGV